MANVRVGWNPQKTATTRMRRMVDKAYETRTPIRDMILDSPLEREEPSSTKKPQESPLPAIENTDMWYADKDPGGGPPGGDGVGEGISGADLVGAGMPATDVGMLAAQVLSAPFMGPLSMLKTAFNLNKNEQLQQAIKIAEAINAAEAAGDPVGTDADVADNDSPIGAPVGPDPSDLGLTGTDADVADNDPAAFGLSPEAGTLGGYGPEGGPVGGLTGADADVADEGAPIGAPVGADPASMGLSGPDADVADNDPGVFGGGFGISGGGEGGIGAGSGVGGIGPGIGGGGFGTSGMPGEGDAGEGGGGNCACIIISACTSRNSPEVNITRAYRDEFLDHQTLAGYYLLATFVVPLIKRYSAVKWLVKRILVDRIVDYCDFQMGGREEMKLKTSKFITEKFLGFCRILGRPVYWILRASRVIQV